MITLNDFAICSQTKPLFLLQLNAYLAVFGIVVLIICVFILIQIVKSESVAQPFLSSLLIYFLLLAIANFQQVGHNLLFFQQIIATTEPLRYYTTFFVYLLTLAAPIYLIFQIEKIFFQDSKIMSKYHLSSIVIIILFVVFLLNVLGFAVTIDIYVVINFRLLYFILVIIPLLGIEVLFVIIAFLYLGIKSKNEYRLYSLMVCIGWLLNYAANSVVTVFNVSEITTLILFIPKLLGVVLTAYGLFKLYSLRAE